MNGNGPIKHPYGTQCILYPLSLPCHCLEFVVVCVKHNIRQNVGADLDKPGVWLLVSKGNPNYQKYPECLRLTNLLHACCTNFLENVQGPRGAQVYPKSFIQPPQSKKSLVHPWDVHEMRKLTWWRRWCQDRVPRSTWRGQVLSPANHRHWNSSLPATVSSDSDSPNTNQHHHSLPYYTCNFTSNINSKQILTTNPNQTVRFSPKNRPYNFYHIRCNKMLESSS